MKKSRITDHTELIEACAALKNILQQAQDERLLVIIALISTTTNSIIGGIMKVFKQVLVIVSFLAMYTFSNGLNPGNYILGGEISFSSKKISSDANNELSGLPSGRTNTFRSSPFIAAFVASGLALGIGPVFSASFVDERNSFQYGSMLYVQYFFGDKSSTINAGRVYPFIAFKPFYTHMVTSYEIIRTKFNESNMSNMTEPEKIEHRYNNLGFTPSVGVSIFISKSVAVTCDVKCTFDWAFPEMGYDQFSNDIRTGLSILTIFSPGH